MSPRLCTLRTAAAGSKLPLAHAQRAAKHAFCPRSGPVAIARRTLPRLGATPSDGASAASGSIPGSNLDPVSGPLLDLRDSSVVPQDTSVRKGGQATPEVETVETVVKQGWEGTQAAGAVETVKLQGWAQTSELQLPETVAPGNKAHRAMGETWHQEGGASAGAAGAGAEQQAGAGDGGGKSVEKVKEEQGWAELEHWDRAEKKAGENAQVAQQQGSQAEQHQQLLSWEEKAERELVGEGVQTPPQE